MKSSIAVSVIAALAFGSLSALAQGSGAEGGRPEIPDAAYRAQQRANPNANPVQNWGTDGTPAGNVRAARSEAQLNAQREYERRNDRRNYDRRDDDRRDDDRRNYGRRDDNRGYNQQQYYYGARGPEFRRGAYIPYEYRNRSYYVNDWRGHHLSAPPRGHQWVQVGSDYVLIALATGLIASLILSQ